MKRCASSEVENPMPLPTQAEDRLAPRGKMRSAHGAIVGEAFLRIRDLIVKGRLAPGAWIVEERLCEHLSMSRTPIRTALYLLWNEGYVTEQRIGGKTRMMVAAVNSEDASYLCWILGRLEGLAGRCAAQRPLPEREPLASELRELNDSLAQMPPEGLIAGSELFEILNRFHRLLMNAGSGPRMAALHRSVSLQAERYWRAYPTVMLDNLHLVIEEHEAIRVALTAGIADCLELAIATSWENGRERLTRAIEMFGEKGSWLANRADRPRHLD